MLAETLLSRQIKKDLHLRTGPDKHSVAQAGELLQVAKTQSFDADYWRSRFFASATASSDPSCSRKYPEAGGSDVLEGYRIVEKVPRRLAEHESAPIDLPAFPDYLEDLPGHIQPTFRVLWKLAQGVVHARGQELATVVTFHLPQELVAAHLNIHPVTLWRHLKVLAERGLVTARAHFTTSKATTRIDGTVWAVAMKPKARASLRHHDLAFQYRDLDADREVGRTAWSLMQSSDTNLQTEEGFLLLKDWAVGGKNSNPVVSDPFTTAQDALWSLESLELVPQADRAEAVTQTASALAQLLNDLHSKRFYAALLWKAIRANPYGGRPLHILQNVITRVVGDMREGFARRPGALLLSRLREGNWLENVLAFPDA